VQLIGTRCGCWREAYCIAGAEKLRRLADQLRREASTGEEAANLTRRRLRGRQIETLA
jgi:hypothetical protein